MEKTSLSQTHSHPDADTDMETKKKDWWDRSDDEWLSDESTSYSTMTKRQKMQQKCLTRLMKENRQREQMAELDEDEGRRDEGPTD